MPTEIPPVVRRGEVYWADLAEGRGSEQKGRRPVLIIQNDIGNRYSSTTIVAAISSKQKKMPLHVELPAGEGGLRQDGIVLTEQIFTLAKERLLERVGRLSDRKMQEVDKALKKSLGLAQ